MSISKRLIIDTDGAPDDIRAISLALQNENVEILAITAVHGVVAVEQAVANVARTLRANKRTVPIYKGASEPLIEMTGKTHNDEYFFGKDGLGDQPNSFPKVQPEDFTSYEQSKNAALALIDLLQQHNDITLVCIGPLTNVALAIKLDEHFVKRPQQMIIMGGNIYGVGNMGSTYTAEFNFGADPEAAYIVMDKMQCPLTVVPWEACFFEGVKHQKEIDFESHLRIGTPLSDYFSMATKIGRQILHKNNRQYAYCDEIAMAIAISDPTTTIINESKLMRASVELHGEYTRGQLACDWTEGFFGEDNSPKVKTTRRRPIKFVISYHAKQLDKMIHDIVSKSIQYDDDM